MAFFRKNFFSRPTQSSVALTKTVSKAIRRERWQWGVLSLAWTAGPVTYFALQGGYYIAYGKLAAPELFIYFAGYTAIAGLFAAFAQFIRQVVIKPQRDSQARRFTYVIDQLFRLYFDARNEYLKSYSPEDQKIVAAWWSCRSASTDVDVMEEMMRDVTGDDDMAYAIKRIEYYRRQGFEGLMIQEHQKYEDQIQHINNNIAERFPSLAAAIKERFQGTPPNVSDGQPRVSGFIERLSAAEEQGNLLLATIDDVLAIYILAIEFLLGREIIALHPEFNGHQRLENVRERFESLRSDFRLLLRKRNGAMRALIEDLIDTEHTQWMQTAGATSQQLHEMLNSVIGKNYTSVGKRRYENIVRLNQKLNALWRKLYLQEKSYNRLWKKQSATLQAKFSQNSLLSRHKGVLSIEETDIFLTEKQKHSFAKKMEEVLEQHSYQKDPFMENNLGNRPSEVISIKRHKKLAITMLNMLDEMLNITEPEELLAIESSREADFGCIEPCLAASTKENWAKTMVFEVQQDRVAASHQLANLLVRYLNVPLGADIIEYLHIKYGASREYLQTLDSEESPNVDTATENLKHELLHFANWQQIKKKANH